MSLPEGTLKTRIKCSFCGVENFIINEDSITGGLNFELSEADIHRGLIDVFSSAKYIPLDIFTECSVKKINKLIVPGYFFVNCTGIGTVHYEKGITTENTYHFDGEEQTNIQTNYHKMTAAVSDTRNYLVSGNKEFDEIFIKLYGNKKFETEIVKAEKLDFPKDSKEYSFDLSESEVYSSSLKEIVDNTVERVGKLSVVGKDIINIHVEGITIQKGEVQKISVALYEIILEYKGTEYKVYITNNGESFAYNELPVDTESKAMVEEKQADWDNADSKVQNIMLAAIIVLCIIGVMSLVFVIGILFLIAAGILLIFYIPRQKEYNAKYRALNNAQADVIEQFIKAKADFIKKQVALKGVLSHLSGNPDAFPELNKKEAKVVEEKEEDAQETEEKEEIAEEADKTEE